MIVVAAAFALSDIVMMKYIAYGMIFSLALDATIIRLLFVPGVMHLLREDNWWAPRWVKRATRSLGEGSGVSTTPRPGETPIEHMVVDTRPGRAGVTVEENASLVPFADLMRDLDQRRALEQLKKKELER